MTWHWWYIDVAVLNKDKELILISNIWVNISTFILWWSRDSILLKCKIFVHLNYIILWNSHNFQLSITFGREERRVRNSTFYISQAKSMTLIDVVRSNVITLFPRFITTIPLLLTLTFCHIEYNLWLYKKKPKICSLERLIFTFWKMAGIYSALICIRFLMIWVFSRNFAKEEKPNTRPLISSNPNFLWVLFIAI